MWMMEMVSGDKQEVWWRRYTSQPKIAHRFRTCPEVTVGEGTVVSPVIRKVNKAEKPKIADQRDVRTHVEYHVYRR